MNKKIILVLVLLLLAYFGLALVLQPKLRSVLQVTPASPETSPSSQTDQAESETKITYQCPGGKTALEALQEKTKKVEVKDYPSGQMVTAIDGLANGNQGKYWVYYIDSSLPNVGADVYRCRGVEKIEWRFEVAK